MQTDYIFYTWKDLLIGLAILAAIVLVCVKVIRK